VHYDAACDFLAQEVSTIQLVSIGSNDPVRRFNEENGAPRRNLVRYIPDFDLKQTSLLVLLNVDIDGEMGVDISHLVSVSLRNTNDHVID
jgi:hypothetical protein